MQEHSDGDGDDRKNVTFWRLQLVNHLAVKISTVYSLSVSEVHLTLYWLFHFKNRRLFAPPPLSRMNNERFWT